MANDNDPAAQHLRQVRQIFDRRAATFADVSFLTREIAQRMGERLDYIKMEPARVLDAGCGPGADLLALAARYPAAEIFGLELSGRMARLATARLTDATRQAGGALRRWLNAATQVWRPEHEGRIVQADLADPPFAAGSFDLIWSNCALHWRAEVEAVFPRWERLLTTKGLLMFSTLGPDSLRELRAAAASVGALDVRVLDFVDMHDYGDMLVNGGFDAPVMDMETLTITYQTPASLLADVRRWGAFPAHRQLAAPSAPLPAIGLAGKREYRALLAALESQRRADGTLALTFEIIYGHAWKRESRGGQGEHAIVRPEDIGGRRARR
ncbi:MAG: methyltransferase domain-containing protein [Janthinobacterium lividum]